MNENYIVTFVPSLKDLKQLKRLLDHLTRKDPTFSYQSRLNFVSFEDTDKKRVFRRAMWVKETLEKDGVRLNFAMSKLKLKEGCP